MNLHVQFVYYVPENSNVQRPTGAKLSCQVSLFKYEFVELLNQTRSTFGTFLVAHIVEFTRLCVCLECPCSNDFQANQHFKEIPAGTFRAAIC